MPEEPTRAPAPYIITPAPTLTPAPTPAPTSASNRCGSGPCGKCTRACGVCDTEAKSWAAQKNGPECQKKVDLRHWWRCRTRLAAPAKIEGPHEHHPRRPIVIPPPPRKPSRSSRSRPRPRRAGAVLAAGRLGLLDDRRLAPKPTDFTASHVKWAYEITLGASRSRRKSRPHRRVAGKRPGLRGHCPPGALLFHYLMFCTGQHLAQIPLVQGKSGVAELPQGLAFGPGEQRRGVSDRRAESVLAALPGSAVPCAQAALARDLRLDGSRRQDQGQGDDRRAGQVRGSRRNPPKTRCGSDRGRFQGEVVIQIRTTEIYRDGVMVGGSTTGTGAADGTGRGEDPVASDCAGRRGR